MPMDTRVLRVDPNHPDLAIIEIAAETLRRGGLVAFPTETVYGLGANAADAAAVKRIFEAKERPASDPIIVHLHDQSQLRDIAVGIPDLVSHLAAAFWPGPLTLVLRRSAAVPALVSAGLDTVAVRVPGHPAALALLRAAAVPVAAPSANRFSRPSATTAAHVLYDLSGRIEIVLDGGPTLIGLESTVLDVTTEPPVILRPGGVTVEALRQVIPDVQVVSKYLHVHDAGIAAPGMLLKHYAPRAELLLYTGETDRVLATMRARAGQEILAGRRAGILATREEAALFDPAVLIFVLGSSDDLSEIAENLFKGIRALDEAQVDVILARAFPADGLGMAINDRLLRAAEGRVISC
jgi:L-threonylcarbamoyladenylate synthase